MTHLEDSVRPLDEDQCWEFLGTCPVGRLAVAIGGEPFVFPVNHRVHEGGLVFRTGEGSKLLAVALGGRVAFEVDTWDRASGGTSVVASGTARELEGAERDEAESLGLVPWVPTNTSRYVRVDVDEVTGRSFTFGPRDEGWHPVG